MEVVSSKTKVRIRPEGEAAVIRLTISCKATVLEEYRAAGLESSDLKAVAGALQEAILQDVRSALDKTIGDWGCDVYGFSRMVKKKAPELVRGREDEWPARLRDCRFEVEVKADAAKAGGAGRRWYHAKINRGRCKNARFCNAPVFMYATAAPILLEPARRNAFSTIYRR